MNQSAQCYINIPTKNNSTGFVFLCPGRHEESKNRPCAGPTGRVLSDALPHLHQLRSDIFASVDRYDYLITNAWPDVEYRAKTRRSLPECTEVAAIGNVRRLNAEISELSHVVACGKLAHLAVRICVEFLSFAGKVAYVEHTSPQALKCPTAAQYPVTVQEWAESVVNYF